MSTSTESVSTTGNGHILTSRLSRISMDITATPFARTRKLNRNLSTASLIGIAPAVTSPTEPLPSPGRKISRTGQPPLLRKASQLQVSKVGPVNSGNKVANGGSAAIVSPTETGTTVSTLPSITESKRMNLTDVVIWRRFTRALKQRVQDKKSEKRTFCWLDRSMSTYGGGDGSGQGERTAEMEPSYRMEPSSKPKKEKCTEMIEKYLAEKLKNVTYEPESCGEVSKEITDDIKREAKRLELLPPRYKCVVYVVLGEKKDQDIRVSSMSAWDKNTDSFVSSSFQNGSIFCVVTFFTVYME
ncbi:uncharacterized protein LOC120326067 [Styela clava]